MNTHRLLPYHSKQILEKSSQVLETQKHGVYSECMSTLAANFTTRPKHHARVSGNNSPQSLRISKRYISNCSLCHCRAILTISSKSAYMQLSNGQISDWAISVVIWIATKIYSLVPFTIPDPSIKFYCNQFITNWDRKTSWSRQTLLKHTG